MQLTYSGGNTEIPISYTKCNGTAQTDKSLESMCGCDVESEFSIHKTGFRDTHCAVAQMSSFLYLYETGSTLVTVSTVHNQSFTISSNMTP
jgi:hypothetical protein